MAGSNVTHIKWKQFKPCLLIVHKQAYLANSEAVGMFCEVLSNNVGMLWTKMSTKNS